MAAEIILGIGPLAFQLYQELDDYFDGLKQRDAEIEAAKAQVLIFRGWLQYINVEIIAKVPLDKETQENVHRSAVVARHRMEELEKFLLSMKLDSDKSQSRRAWAKKHARELFYPFQREDLKKLQQQLESLNTLLDRALKPFEHQFHNQFHQRTDAELAKITGLLQSLTAPATQAHDSALVDGTDPRLGSSIRLVYESGTSRALTPEETECLQTFRLTQGDRDASYEWYKDRVDERVADTCQWFLGHDHYQTWLHQRAGPLLVTADPGCGKSVLAKYLIDHELPRDATICYFFFKDQDQNKINQALCAVLHQLFSARPHLLQHARAARERNGKGLVHITAELRSIFDAAARDPEAGDTIFVFDALDECDPADLKILVDIMNDAFLKAPPEFKVKCLMTSRPYEQVSGEFAYLVERFPQIRIPGERESETIRMEVERVVQVRVKNLAKKRKLSPKLQEHLESRLLKASHRTYLWVYLVFEYLEEEAFKRTARGLDDVLRTLPNSVNDAYEKILSRSKEDGFVRKALSFIVTAVRPLEVSELNVALHVEAEHTSNFDLDLEEDEEFEQRLRDCCGLFLTINHGKVYLLHQTAREFLLEKTWNPKSGHSHIAVDSSGGHGRPTTWQNSMRPEDADLIVAEACVAYLRNLDPAIFGLSGPDGSSSEMEGLRQNLKENVEFLQYSSHYWDHHVRGAQKSSNFSSLLDILAFQDKCSETYWRMARFWLTSFRLQYHERAYASADHQLHLAAALDHIKIVEFLVGYGANVNAGLNDYLDPPLRHAALAGSCEVVRYLLAKGADVNGVATASSRRRTALFPTTSWMSEEIVDVLLKSGADPNFEDQHRQTPLFFASSGRMAQLLLEAGAKVDVVDADGYTPLLKATQAESKSVVTMLIQWGANPNIRLMGGLTPLYEAVQHEWWEGVEILLHNGGDINAMGIDGEHSIWSFMASKALPRQLGRQALLVPTHLLSLIQEKLQLDENNLPVTTPLHIAAHYGLQDSVEQLLKAGAIVDARDEEGATPLIVAASAQSRDKAILELLLHAGANPDKASNNTTPLLAAVNLEWEDGVRVLLDAGANPNIETAWVGSAALGIAASFGLESVLKMLIERGADVNAADRCGKTALQLAMEWGEESIAQILRAAGAREDKKE